MCSQLEPIVKKKKDSFFESRQIEVEGWYINFFNIFFGVSFGKIKIVIHNPPLGVRVSHLYIWIDSSSLFSFCVCVLYALTTTLPRWHNHSCLLRPYATSEFKFQVRVWHRDTHVPSRLSLSLSRLCINFRGCFVSFFLFFSWFDM